MPSPRLRTIAIALTAVLSLACERAADAAASAGGGEPSVEAGPGATRPPVAAEYDSSCDAGPARAGDSRSIAIAPALPRRCVDVRMPPPARRIVRAATAASLQRALDAARDGDEIRLTAGVRYVGNFLLPRRSGAPTGWVVLRSDAADSLLPRAGARAEPRHARAMATLATPNRDPALGTAAGASGFRIVGLEITAEPAVTRAGALVSLGSADRAQSTLAAVPHHLVLDRVWVHGHGTLDFQRCIALHSAHTAVIGSTVNECHGRGFDSQAIWGSNGPGPYLIENNALEGAGENLYFGGDDPKIPGLIPSDITVRRNHIVKPLAWKGVWSVKNLFELKNAQRVLVDGNVFENNWVDAQIGFALTWKSVNQDGRAPWSTTSDVTFRYNVVRNVASVLSVAGSPERNPAVRAARILVTHNSFEHIGSAAMGGIGRVFQIENTADVELSNNAGLGTAAGVLLVGGAGASPRLSVLDNVLAGSHVVHSADGQGVGTQALDFHAGAERWRFTGNVLVGAPLIARVPYPAGNRAVGALPRGLSPQRELESLRSIAGRAGPDRERLARHTQGVAGTVSAVGASSRPAANP